MKKIDKGNPLEELVKGSMEYTMELIQQAFRKQFPRDYERDPWYYVAETFAEYVIVRSDDLRADEYYRVGFTREGESFTFVARESWEVVELTYQPQTSLSESKGAKIVEDFGYLALDESSGKPRRIKATGLTAGVINGNRRRYSPAVVKRAVEEAQSHLNESLGQGRLQLLGEVEHPSTKGGRPNLFETVFKWDQISFDGRQVLLEGNILSTAKGKDVQALLEGGVQVPLSQRAYGDVVTVKEDGSQVDEVVDLHITGYDATLTPSDPQAAIQESQTQPQPTPITEKPIMTPEEMKKLIEAHPELGITAQQLEEMNEKQLKALEATLRKTLKIGEDDKLGPALEENLNAKKMLDELQNLMKISAAIEEHTKDLRYGREINAKFVESIKASKPATPDAVKELVEVRKREYDALFATEALKKAGFKGIEVIGPVIEEDLEIPAFAYPAFELSESIRKSEMRQRRDLSKPKTVNEEFTKQYLAKYDQQNKRHLLREAREFEEAETVSDLNIPYSVARAVIAEAFPTLVTSGIFDFGLVDTSPFRLYFEAFSGETGYLATVTDENVVSDENDWVDLVGKRVTPGSVVVEPNGGGVAYTEGTDYVVDYANGRFWTISAANGGTIGNGTALDVDYTYTAIRKGEMAPIERGETHLSFVTVEAAADRLADQISREAVVFSRSQIGYDAVARTLTSLIRQVRRKIDQGVIYKALAAALIQASNSGGTWVAAVDPLSEFVEKVGVAKIKVLNRYYDPTFLLLSVTNSDKVANWDGFTAAGDRPDTDLNANGFIGRLKGLPVFESTEMSDAYGLVGNRELVMHRVYQAMQIMGPYPTYDVSGGTSKLLAADQYYIEEFNATEAPVPEKGSYVKVS